MKVLKYIVILSNFAFLGAIVYEGFAKGKWDQGVFFLFLAYPILNLIFVFVTTNHTDDSIFRLWLKVKKAELQTRLSGHT